MSLRCEHFYTKFLDNFSISKPTRSVSEINANDGRGCQKRFWWQLKYRKNLTLFHRDEVSRLKKGKSQDLNERHQSLEARRCTSNSNIHSRQPPPPGQQQQRQLQQIQPSGRRQPLRTRTRSSPRPSSNALLNHSNSSCSSRSSLRAPLPLLRLCSSSSPPGLPVTLR